MILSIYPTSSGQWAGLLTDADGLEVLRVAGCTNVEEVEEAVRDSGFSDFDTLIP